MPVPTPMEKSIRSHRLVLTKLIYALVFGLPVITNPYYSQSTKPIENRKDKCITAFRYQIIFDTLVSVKGARSRNRKQTCYLSNLYRCPNVAIGLCTDSDGWGESTIKVLLKIHQCLCNHTTYECFVCLPIKFKSPSSK